MTSEQETHLWDKKLTQLQSSARRVYLAHTSDAFDYSPGHFYFSCYFTTSQTFAADSGIGCLDVITPGRWHIGVYIFANSGSSIDGANLFIGNVNPDTHPKDFIGGIDPFNRGSLAVPSYMSASSDGGSRAMAVMHWDLELRSTELGDVRPLTSAAILWPRPINFSQGSTDNARFVFTGVNLDYDRTVPPV